MTPLRKLFWEWKKVRQKKRKKVPLAGTGSINWISRNKINTYLGHGFVRCIDLKSMIKSSQYLANRTFLQTEVSLSKEECLLAGWQAQLDCQEQKPFVPVDQSYNLLPGDPLNTL